MTEESKGTFTMEINETIARKVLTIVDAGLVKGVGNPRAGEMCVEAAVCFAMGLPHGDDPQCVSRALRSLKIKLNDSSWSSNAARAKGLRRLAVVQLGSRGILDDLEFTRRVKKLAIKTCVPTALRAAATLQRDAVKAQLLLDAANVCEREGTHESALAARNAVTNAADASTQFSASIAAEATAFAASTAEASAQFAASAAADASAFAANAAANAAAFYANAARDKSLADFAEGVVQILISMDAPGVKWLALAELGAA